MSERLVGLEPKIEYGMLLSFYGALLTDRQMEMAALYCNEDMGIGEIARQLNVSRQCASITLRNGFKRLKELERALGLVSRYSSLHAAVRRCGALLSAVSASTDTQAALSEAKQVLRDILEQEGG